MGEKTTITRYSGKENNHSTFRVGVVYACNISSYTVDVKLPGEEDLQGVPMLNSQGASYENSIQWLHKLRGAHVVIIRIGQKPYVMGTLPLQDHVLDEDSKRNSQPVSIFGSDVGGEDPNYKKEVYLNHRNNRATDFNDADKVLQTSSGTGLSLLDEGLAILKASPMSQFILGRFKDFFRLIARVGSYYSDFGEVNFTHNTEGRVGIYVKGGAKFKEETNPITGAGATVQNWFGDCPGDEDARYHLVVNSVDNSQSTTIRLGLDGNMASTATNSISESAKKNIGNSAGKNISLGAGKNLSASAKKNLSASAGKEITISAGKNVTITGSKVFLN